MKINKCVSYYQLAISIVLCIYLSRWHVPLILALGRLNHVNLNLKIYGADDISIYN